MKGHYSGGAKIVISKNIKVLKIASCHSAIQFNFSKNNEILDILKKISIDLKETEDIYSQKLEKAGYKWVDTIKKEALIALIKE